MMKEYNHESKLVFVIDEDGDSFESFQKSSNTIRETLNPDECDFKNGYWDESNGYFMKDGIIVYLEYSNWTGTILRVDENLDNIKLSKVRHWAEEIYKAVHNNESPT
jgi:hypothetical protein